VVSTVMDTVEGRVVVVVVAAVAVGIAGVLTVVWTWVDSPMQLPRSRCSRTLAQTCCCRLVGEGDDAGVHRQIEVETLSRKDQDSVAGHQRGQVIAVPGQGRRRDRGIEVDMLMNPCRPELCLASSYARREFPKIASHGARASALAG